jgi:hypothetical protein
MMGGSLPVDVLEEFEPKKKKKKTLVADGTYKVGFIFLINFFIFIINNFKWAHVASHV